MRGLLDALTDPVLMAEIEQRNLLVKRLAAQMGVTTDEARSALWQFEEVATSEGQSLQ